MPNTDIIMVRGRTSNRVGDALSKMLEGSKPRQAGHNATAGELDAEPTPQLTHQSAPLPSPSLPGRSPVGGDSVSSPPALSLVWDREEIRIDYFLEEISEFEAIKALNDTGMSVCDAMEFLDSWS